MLTLEQQVFLVTFFLTLNQVSSFVSVFVTNLEDIFLSFVIIAKYENNYVFVLSSRVFTCEDKILWRILMTVIRRTNFTDK